MKIQYDHQIFTIQKFGGISRYHYELISRFDHMDECNLSCIFSNNLYLSNNSYKYKHSFYMNSNYNNRIINLINKTNSVNKILFSDYTIFHPTYYSTYFLKFLKRPFVITVHDMIHEKFSHLYKVLKDDTQTINSKRLLIEKADKIIAVSETTKNDIIDTYNISSNKIHVVYHGNSLNRLNYTPKRLINKDYLLFVGKRSLYKNFNRYIQSIRDLLIKYDLLLICAGGGDFTNTEYELFKIMDLQNKIIYKDISNDEELFNFYNGAILFTFPSIYEGFGIPILESFASNCPTLLSNTKSFTEVAGNAAEYFDPNDNNSIYHTTDKIIFDTTRRNELVNLGSQRLKNFNWDKTYKETLDVYRKII